PLARCVEDNGGVYFVPAFSGLYTPYWKHNARGVITGLTRYANKGHLARAVLEATAFQTREVVEAMEKDCGAGLEVLRVDGGMVENDLLRSDNGGVYFVPAFSGLYTPYWKHNARGVITGLTRYANKGHLARAVLEATAFQTREVVEAMEKDCGAGLEVLRVDGGMVENDLLMQ